MYIVSNEILITASRFRRNDYSVITATLPIFSSDIPRLYVLIDCIDVAITVVLLDLYGLSDVLNYFDIVEYNLKFIPDLFNLYTRSVRKESDLIFLENLVNFNEAL